LNSVARAHHRILAMLRSLDFDNEKCATAAFSYPRDVFYSRLGGGKAAMSDPVSPGTQERTAVLVVHGMGSQRPLDTVRGVVNAVWRDNPANKVWFHPEPSGTDIDLTVQTTSYVPDEKGAIPPNGGRRVDFHEFYWAHLIAETRAVAVLLWLFEVARRGPFLKHGMRPIWWVGATYLVCLILSASYLASDLVERLARVEQDRLSVIGTPLLTVFIITAFCAVWAMIYFSFRLAGWSVVFAAATASALWFIHKMLPGCAELIEGFATHFLPATFTFVIAWLLLSRWVFGPFIAAYVISVTFHLLKPLVVTGSFEGMTLVDFVPWSLASPWSSVAAWLFLTSYFVLSAAFLQPYIGDVARYLRNSPANVAGRRDIRRNSVDTLLALHRSGKYDRIVVVAHSLGTMVAYDMLRATFARLFRDMPVDRTELNPEFCRIDAGGLGRVDLRRNARAVMRKLYALMMKKRAEKAAQNQGEAAEKKGEPLVWLVTDFVTLGSPLTHAQYLLCHGKTVTGPIRDVSELIEDFERRVKERELPTCQPKKFDGDDILTYGRTHFHQAALFGLTRWTNIYFPLKQVFWGDPIGGPVAMYETNEKDANGRTIKKELFGTDIADVAVSLLTSGDASFFTHTAYWSVERPKDHVAPTADKDDDPPHIQALKLAIDLRDVGAADDPDNFRKIKGVKLAEDP
jgi:hypothetical protein